MRTIFIPAALSSLSFSMGLVLGPIVQIIEVLLPEWEAQAGRPVLRGVTVQSSGHCRCHSRNADGSLSQRTAKHLDLALEVRTCLRWQWS